MSIKPFHLIIIIALIGCGKSADEYYAEGEKELSNGNIKEALESIDLAIEKEEDWNKKEDFLNTRAEIYIDQNKTELAISDYLNLIRNGGDLGYYYNELGNCFYDLDSLNDAIHYYKKALEIYEYDTIVQYNLASIYFFLEQYNLAEVYFTKAIQLGLKDSTILRDRATCYNSMGKFNLAIKDLIDQESKFGKSALNSFELGEAYAFNKEFDMAIKAYNEALKLTIDKKSEILTARADAFFYLNEIEKAKNDLHEALLIDSTFSEAHFQLGFIEYDNDNYPSAINSFSKAIQLGDSSIEAFVFRGDALMRLNKKEESCIDIKYAASLGDIEAIQMVKDLCN